MPEDQFSKPQSDVTAEACAWLAQIESGDMGPGDELALKEWTARSPRHTQELIKISKLSEDLNVLADLADPVADDLKANSPLVRTKQKTWQQRWRPIAASFLVLASFGTVGILKLNQSTAPEPYLVTTLIGNSEERTLSDGSVIKLNTDSVVEIDFVKTQRRVRLVKGEAFFEVAHNKERPFIVYVDDKMVRAVGTAFGVRWTKGNLFVTVSEGRVAFESVSAEMPTDDVNETTVPATKIARPQFLDAGDKLTIRKDVPVIEVAEVNLRQMKSEFAWRNGILDFSQRPLAEVIDEINRYSNLKVEITDPQLREIEFGGLFRIGDTDALFEVLELSFEIEVERVSDTLIRIRANSTEQ